MRDQMKNRTNVVVLLTILFVLTLPVSGLAQLFNIHKIEANYESSYALHRDGKIISWGSNGNGQLGYSTSPLNYSVNPGLILDIRDVTLITSASFHALALKGDGTVWAWGYNLSGQFGIGTKGGNYVTPVQVKMSASEFMTGVESVSTSTQRTYFLKEDGTVWGIGDNSNGELGIGMVFGGPCGGSGYCYPVQVKNSSTANDFLKDVILVSSGYSHTVVKKIDGSVWAWGMNMSGEIGDGTMERRYYPVRIKKNASEYLSGVVDIKANGMGSNTIALLEDRSVWTWGSNVNYLLGIGSTSTSTSRVYPQQVEVEGGGYLTDVIAISIDNRRATALKADGTVWVWGAYYLGDGTTNYRTRAVQVKTSATEILNDVMAITSGGSHSLAIKSDGSVWGWGDNNSGQVGTGNRTVQLYAVPVQMPKTLISLVSPWMVSPGQRGTFNVFYQNIFNDPLADTVIVMDLPKSFQYVSSTQDGIMWDDGVKHQVFWKLGNLGSLQTGNLSVTIQVPGGLPDSLDEVSAEIGARNLTSNFNLDEYLNYNPKNVVSEKTLTVAEINSLLSSDPKLKELYEYALSLGYAFYDVGKQIEFSDGDSITTLTYIDPIGKNVVLLHRVEDQVFLENYVGSTYTRFDQNGGYTVDLNEGTIHAWGTWAESHSLKFFHCLFNCFGQKFATWAVKKILGLGGAIGMGVNCFKCMQYQDIASCAKCVMEVLDVGMPIISPAVDFGKCLGECARDPNKHYCTHDLLRCSRNETAAWLIGLDVDWSVRTVCDKTIGAYSPLEQWLPCNVGQKCYNGECLSLRQIEYKGTFTSGAVKIQNVPVMSVRNVVTRRAWDPNEKTVDYPGNVIPGQRLTYTIEFENTGKGTAYNVFILDELDPNLDESTLTDNNGGSFLSPKRLLTWEIGTVPPGGKGAVTFSVNVKSNVNHGTQILNVANIHFPSVPQITPTSPVVNIVKTTVGDSQNIETTSGIPKAIVLTGRDFYNRPLTYRVTKDPIHGTLTGTPPNIIYTPAGEFSGQDELFFVVNNGTNDSDPARVAISVLPDPSDKTPPTVTGTYPAANSVDVPAPNQPVTTTPIVEYRPKITATFSEPVKPETVNENTFMIGGLSGKVYYDEVLRTASFIPSSPLQASTVYTALLTTGITDMAGNPISSNHSWQFKTVGQSGITVTLPDNAPLLDFGNIFVNETSPGKNINVTSTGNDSVSILSVNVTGDFRILEDQCNGMNLPRFENCIIKVAFAPKSVGISQGNVEIRSTDSNTSLGVVNLRGTGIIAGIDQDGDGYTADVDCNDNDPTIYPGAQEICDGKDNNCDGQIDEGVKNTYYQDTDGDGYGNPSISIQACEPPQGYVSNNLDCNDSNAAIYPGATEVCGDGIDNNCDGKVDEGCIPSVRISGGAYFFPESIIYRASFSMDVTGPSNPSGWLKYYYTRTRMNFVSTRISSVTVSVNTATISGTGTVNGVGGYSFTANVTNGSPDSFAIVIKRSDGATYYSAGPKNISGGDLVFK